MQITRGLGSRAFFIELIGIDFDALYSRAIYAEALGWKWRE
jgi:hypothetical protein